MEIDMVRRAKREEISAAAKLAVLMWGGHSEEELAEEFSEILSGGKAQFFLKYEGDEAVGFAQCQLRYDYVEGTKREEISAAAKLAVLMWGGHSEEELAEEFSEILSGGKAQFFLKYEGDEAVGFAQCQLRYDYVEGTETSPVGYLEGIFVKEGCRRKGYAKEMLAACEAWAREMGCREFASDCELDNGESERFHRAVGFSEANRIICFAKKI